MYNISLNSTNTVLTLSPSTISYEYCWLIGVAVTFVGQIINNFGTNVVKYSHIISETQSVYDTGRKRKSWIIFCAGWMLFVLGISLDFISFAYTAQSILAAVASIQFVSNLVFARLILKEQITKAAILGSISILIGTILIGVVGDHKSPLLTSNALIQFFKSVPFIIWISSLFGVGIILEISYHCINIHTLKKHNSLHNNSLFGGGGDGGNDERDEIILDKPDSSSYRRSLIYPLSGNNEVHAEKKTFFQRFCKGYLPFIFCFTSSIVGVQTPILGKSMSLMFRDTILGNNQFDTPYPYILGVFFIFFGSIWVYRYNSALKKYNILYAMPVITACYITLNIIGGGIYFEEFINFDVLRWALFALGGCFIITGIVLISFHGSKRS